MISLEPTMLMCTSLAGVLLLEFLHILNDAHSSNFSLLVPQFVFHFIGNLPPPCQRQRPSSNIGLSYSSSVSPKLAIVFFQLPAVPVPTPWRALFPSLHVSLDFVHVLPIALPLLFTFLPLLSVGHRPQCGHTYNKVKISSVSAWEVFRAYDGAQMRCLASSSFQ